ncbi:MAG TPA: hypothetical protein VFW68_12290 [Rhodocyclaceae bacterium]|nr:hypothetical protein [Rhodocyclaceae bacterium]
MSIQITVADTPLAAAPMITTNAGVEKAVRLPSFDEVMAELMLEMAIRDVSRKADARMQRKLPGARG